MFGSLGFQEMIVIFIIALIIFGPKKLPEIGRTIGKALGEFKKATDDFKNTVEREVRVEELKQLASTQLPVVDTVSRTEPAAEPASAPQPSRDPAEPLPPAEPMAPPEPMTVEQIAALSAAPQTEQHD